MSLLKHLSDYEASDNEINQVLKAVVENEEKVSKRFEETKTEYAMLKTMLMTMIENNHKRKEAASAAQRESSTAPSSSNLSLIHSTSMSPVSSLTESDQDEEMEVDALTLETRFEDPEIEAHQRFVPANAHFIDDDVDAAVVANAVPTFVADVAIHLAQNAAHKHMSPVSSLTESDQDEEMEVDALALETRFEDPGIDARDERMIPTIADAVAFVDDDVDAAVVATVVRTLVADVADQTIHLAQNAAHQQVLQQEEDAEAAAKAAAKALAKDAFSHLEPTKSQFLGVFVNNMYLLENKDVNVIVLEDGTNLSETIKRNEPILVKNKKKVGIKVPTNMTFGRLSGIFKRSTMQMSVIRSRSQDTKQMPVIELIKLLMKSDADGLNLLSLEMQNLNKKLASMFGAPTVAAKLSWVQRAKKVLKTLLAELRKNLKIAQVKDKSKLLAQIKKHEMMLEKLPNLEKFLLLSGKKSFTGVHVDMAATSVFYHVITGRKLFFLARPTEKNLAIYKKHEGGNISKWLGSELFEEFQILEINPGQTAFIPAGWIHFVYTPEDSIVFGGNYLTDEGAELQFEYAELERQLVEANRIDESTAYTDFGSTVFCYAELVLNKELETKATSLEVGGQILSGLRGLVRNEANEPIEQNRRHAIIKKLEETLTLCANNADIDSAQFLASCEVKEYDFKIKRLAVRKRKLALSDTTAEPPAKRRTVNSRALAVPRTRRAPGTPRAGRTPRVLPQSPTSAPSATPNSTRVLRKRPVVDYAPRVSQQSPTSAPSATINSTRVLRKLPVVNYAPVTQRPKKIAKR